MWASEMIKILEKGVQEFGDRRIMVIEQTGPDSFRLGAVKEVVPAADSAGRPCFVLETKT